MTDSAKELFSSLAGTLGARQIVSWGVGLVLAIFTAGTFIGAVQTRESFRAARGERQELRDSIRTEQRVNARQDEVLQRLQDEQDRTTASLEEIRMNTCLTLMEVRGDPNTDRCRRLTP